MIRRRLAQAGDGGSLSPRAIGLLAVVWSAAAAASFALVALRGELRIPALVLAVGLLIGLIWLLGLIILLLIHGLRDDRRNLP